MESEKEAPRELDILDGLKDRIEEILTQFKEGTGDIKSAWEDIRTQLVAAYEFGSDHMETDDDDLSGVDTSELIDELSDRNLNRGDADWLSGIVLKYNKH